MTPRENLNNWRNDPRNIGHQIIRITWNWYYTTDSDYGEEYKSAEVGKNGVAEIEALDSDGIPGVYRVTLEPDSEGVVYTTTIYNPCEVVEELRHIGPDPKAETPEEKPHEQRIPDNLPKPPKRPETPRASIIPDNVPQPNPMPEPPEKPNAVKTGLNLWALRKKAEYLANQTGGKVRHSPASQYSSIQFDGVGFNIYASDPQRLEVEYDDSNEAKHTDKMTTEEMVLFINTTVGR